MVNLTIVDLAEWFILPLMGALPRFVGALLQPAFCLFFLTSLIMNGGVYAQLQL